LGLRQPATASAALMAGGMQDEARLLVGWQAGDSDYLEISGDLQRFQAQDGSELGELSAGSVGYRRLLTPAAGGWSLEAGVTVADTRVETTLPSVLLPLLPVGEAPDPGFFVPPPYTQYRLALAFGTEVGEGYQAYWQPFGEVGATDDRETGSGYDFRLGVLGPVLGEDRLRFFVEGARGAQSGQERRVLVSVTYSLRY
ncbi:MAG: Extracellular Matrix protein PelB, partial [Moraxellaceae bacterium]|nr:Extracellular Matrix protein PelB [Moraxellaceae bacterium]